MRHWLCGVAALTLVSCSTATEVGTTDFATASTAPIVAQIVPERMASLDPSDSILFWSDERRSTAFREMEKSFAGIEVTPRNTARELPRSAAPIEGELARDLRAFMRDTSVAGLMVLRDGEIVFEEYGLGLKPQDRWTSFSVAKSFTSTLLGAAIEDGFIESLDTPVTSVVPSLAGTAYDGVTVGQVATMTSGVAWNEDYTDPDSDVAKMLAVAPVEGESQAVTYARTLIREAPAGEKWVYKTLETNLLGLIVEEATGKSLAEYAAQKIVLPAGFEGPLFWMQDLTGGNIGGCCLSLRLSDYARFGQFVLEGGKGVVPDGWFEAAGAAQVDFAPRAPGFGYGYQWWAYPNGYFGAQGIFGQAITIVPEEKLVVAVISNWPTATSSDNRMRFLKLVARMAEAGRN